MCTYILVNTVKNDFLRRYSPFYLFIFFLSSFLPFFFWHKLLHVLTSYFKNFSSPTHHDDEVIIHLSLENMNFFFAFAIKF